MSIRFSLRTPTATKSAACSGVTLIELIVTLAVMGVFASIAVPGMQSFIASSRMKTAGSDFTLAVQRSRAEAMANNQCVVLCKSPTQTSTGNPICDSSEDNWAVGWAAYRLPSSSCLGGDRPNSATEANTAVSEGRLLFYQEALHPNLQIRTVGTATRFLVFSPRGIASLSGAGRFNVLDSTATSSQQSQFGRTVCVDKMGRARSLELYKDC